LIESGTPPVVVLGPEALGLDSAPVDLHVMPDGRILAFGRAELALGDGTRWEVFRQADEDPHGTIERVAVDSDGRIYAGMAGGFGEVRFRADGRWTLVRAASLPEGFGGAADAMTTVVEAGRDWYWSRGSGTVVTWRPGQPARMVGRINALATVFSAYGAAYMSDESSGALYLQGPGGFGPAMDGFKTWDTSRSITCAVPTGDRGSLVGTIDGGLMTFDGANLRPFVARGPLSVGVHRINDLCDAGFGYLAVAVDNLGVVFINRQGRILQEVDRTLDNRLARAQRLIRQPGGGIWVLMAEGIARIRFPSRFSSYEAMVSTGLTFAMPYRHEGRLWLLSDGKAQRGDYDEDNRLVGFRVDNPGPYLTSMVDLHGEWVACTEDGIFRREPEGGWTLLAQGPKAPNIRPAPVLPGQWLYSAEGEVGWLHLRGEAYSFERFPVPAITHVYGAVADAKGVFWEELGTGYVARVEPTLPRPTVEVLGPPEGLHDAWVQLFVFEGEVRANMRDQILRYDSARHRFVPDTALLRRIPVLGKALGRPVTDAGGRLWVTLPDRVLVLDPATLRQAESTAGLPKGLQPMFFTPQGDGAVWMNQPMRLARFDPSVPSLDPAPPAAMITRVELPATGQVLFPADGRIADLPSQSSTLLFHFLCPDQPLGSLVVFDVDLVGSDTGWVSTGGTGSITFNHLDPGAYRLRVRPRDEFATGREATLDFVILAPWYRKRSAYALFGLGALCSVGGAVWFSTYFERRERLRLERLVAQRTAALELQIQETTEKTDALRTSEERFRRLNDNAPDIIFRIRVGPNVGFDYISPAVLAITGYPPGDFLANPALVREITRPEGSESIYDIAVQGRQPERIREVRWAARGGRVVILEERLSAVVDASGGLIAIEGISRDITERVEEHERRLKLESQLLQSQKLESVGTLAGGIAHDFNNILLGILGFCELAAYSVATDPEEVRRCLGQIRSAGLRAKDMVNRILTFSRRADYKLVAVQLASVVREALTLVRASTPSTIEIVTELGDGVVMADSTQIHQVVINLCTNAVHAMRGGPGTLRIEVRRIGPDAPEARDVPNLPRGGTVRLSVSDTGHGIEGQTLGRIFDPFFTTKEMGSGTGLGLSIVQGIVANHGGALRVQSELGRGATFEVYLPETTENPSGPPPNETPRQGGGRRVLVVDDEPLVLNFVTAALRRSGYEVAVFGDSREALAAFLAAPERFDAIVTDMTMPKLTGLDLIQQVRAAGSAVPVILMSGFNKALGELRTELLGRTQLISKPFDAVDLAQALGRLLARSP
jgi:PAS domain S-box-containing protein